MKSLSLYHVLAVDEFPLYLKIEVRMGFCNSSIFNNNDLFAHQKDFLWSDDTGNGSIFTCAGGLRFPLI